MGNLCNQVDVYELNNNLIERNTLTTSNTD
jgi:hypothetical protein